MAFVPSHRWPAALLGDALHALREETLEDALRAVRSEVPSASDRFVHDVVLPLAGHLRNRVGARPLIVALSGPPGSGKSSLSRMLEVGLRHLFGLASAGFSLDDVYLTKVERQALARDVHPLLAVRGVPGTHDLPLAHRLLDELLVADVERPVWLPRFDKLADDRAPPEDERRVAERLDLVLLDGWCWGMAASDARSLETPINQREAVEDPDGRWRRWVAAQLAGPYRALFSRADLHVRLTAPSWQAVLDWRGRQECDLLHSPPSEALRARIEQFLALSERIARSHPVPAADLVLALDERHELQRVTGSGFGSA